MAAVGSGYEIQPDCEAITTTIRHVQHPVDRSFETLGSLILRYKWRFLLLNLLRISASLMIVVHPYFFAEFVSSIDDKDRAFHYLTLLLISGGIHTVLWTVCDFAVSRWINPLSYEFKRIGFESFWKNDYAVFVDRPSGKVGSYVNDLQRHSLILWDSFHFGFLPMLSSLPVYIYLFHRASWRNSVGYAIFLLVAGAILTLASKPVKSTQHHLTDTVATNNGRVFDSYANFVNVFSFRSQQKEISRHNADTLTMRGDEIRSSTALSAYWGVAAFLVRGVLWSFVILYNWYLYDRGDISFAALVISITVLLDFTVQYWEVVHHLGVWVDSSAAYQAAYTYLFPGRNILTELDDGAVGIPNDNSIVMTESLELRDLSFSYPDRPDMRVLRNINLRVAAGEKVGVVGRSGEGKSTLIKILLGFYEQTGGELLVDGEAMNPDRLRGLTAYVPQDTSLFQESVAYNIAYASGRELSDAEIRAAAHKAHIGEFIESLPDGYDTMVGERGIKLSLGQRQRIAIARAFVKPSNLLILDEATSALDSETEQLIQESLEDLLRGKAAIVIAHRLATLDSMDRIIVVEGGRIVEEGTKQQLLDSGGMFADLWSRQRATSPE